MAAKTYDYARADREAAEGRPSIIARVRSLREAAATVRSSSLAQQYRKGAANLMSRHSISEAELQ